MTLIKYNKTLVESKPAGVAALKIHRKDAFCLNWQGVELTGFQAGDKVCIVNQITKDGPYENSEWYLVKDADGYELKGKPNRHHLLFFNNKMARMVLDKNNLPGDVYSFKIANTPTILEDVTKGWCLLFNSNP